MGIGKYLHRRKGDTPSPQQPNRQSRVVSQEATDPATSRYETTALGSSPQTGSYPLKGTNSAAAVTRPKASAPNSMNLHGDQSPEKAPSYPSTAPRLETPPQSDFSDYHFFDQPQTSTQTRTQTVTTVSGGRSPSARQMEADSGLAQDFSGMNLRNDPTASNATQPLSYYPNSGPGRLDPRVDAHPRNEPNLRTANQSAPQQQYKSPSSYQRAQPGYYDDPQRGPVASESHGAQPKDTPRYDDTAKVVPARGSSKGYTENGDLDLRRRDSIPRKQVGSSLHTPSGSVFSASPNAAGFPSDHGSQQAPPVPQHDTPLSQSNRYQDPSAAAQQYSSSSRQSQSGMPSYQQNRHQETPAANQQYSSSPKQSQSGMSSYQQNRYQDPSSARELLNYNPGPVRQSIEPRQMQDSAQKRIYNNPRSEGQRDGFIAPLSLRSKQPPKDGARGPAAAHVVERALQSNTYDTDVIEKVAPAVMHETVQQKTHHIREEVITREVHTHDVFHRILPVIDVEVLPPRHFLPVEGGGLVEIGADEVPGRGNNWIIAETASKIPSDQPAPKGASRFTARQFPRTEGDAVQYTTGDGIEHTETTWVHPPELETGGRDTGQTWPMVFGKDTSSDGPVRSQGTPSKQGKTRSKKSSSMSRAAAA